MYHRLCLQKPWKHGLGHQLQSPCQSSLLLLLSVPGPFFSISSHPFFLFVFNLVLLPFLSVSREHNLYFYFYKWNSDFYFCFFLKKKKSPGNLFGLKSLGTTESYYTTGRLLPYTYPGL